MYEVFNYMTAETIGYVATEDEAWYVVRNDTRPLDFLHWTEAETPEPPEPWCEHGTDPSCTDHPADEYEIDGENEW